MSANVTARYALGMCGLVVGGFWLAGFLLSVEVGAAAGSNTVTATKSVGIFSLAISLSAAVMLLAVVE
ncbi:hypothetical protein GL213_13860 [Halogeometricum borinquense]|uniref:Uncharacterized protein n=2 Tax=Halogeometricum borinquense TaxID=60847 RepID=E4NL93_HALBP|nr:hypothetical protein [Halogeometricum borinquense]ADQ68342.1 hypothetical protein Hbor_27980 [Halogeometricum borinquense DSM 11551]ELY24617.1 hypothetical protein C499_14490 [Halogeometricum borinquense DSM 11551]QIB73085.1 hypothetical protein G3I44_01580 [Halogeometricum borinquense]QIQ77515.1 hypothetical protein GL213_13860 [Halogeometricum borinquense]RYJ12774.1 hypothetical protein ELS19_01500 [Halogeometricum borinquense]